MNCRRLAFGCLQSLLLAGFVLSVGLGCRSKMPPAAVQPPPPPKPATKPVVDAWINGKDFCTLPLSEKVLPPTGAELTQSLLKAWSTGIALKSPDRAVTLIGGRYPAVDVFRVDLSNAVVKTGKTKPDVKDSPVRAPALAVGQFAFVAEPMISNKAPLNMMVTGSDVRFSLRADKQGQSFLVMTDAREATLHFDASTADLEKAMLTIAREQGAKKGLIVRKIELNLRATSSRTIEMELYCHTLVGLLPAGLKFTARVDVDNQMNAKLSNLTVDGDDLLGPLVTHLLRPAMKKQEGKTKPLISFPGGMQLKDVQIRGGKRITLDAVFAK